MLTSLWPILLVIAANTVYHICAKGAPRGIHPFATLTVTYTVAALASALLYYLTSDTKHLLTEVRHLNWTAIALGLAIVALEFGYLQVYRAGWNISMGSLIANIGLALVLLTLGVLFYKEQLSASQLIGFAFCLVGIIFLSKH